jgi:hypothetical protein
MKMKWVDLKNSAKPKRRKSIGLMKIQVLQLIDANLTEKNQYMKDIRNKEVIVMISVILTVVIFITYNIVKHGM